MEKLVPKLRFPEFEENWMENSLESIAKFSKGKGISKSDTNENGKFECIRYGELYTVYSETIREIKSKTNLESKDLIFSEENDVIIPASGETQIDIATASCVLKAGVALGGDLNIIKTTENGVFLSYYLNNKKKNDIANLAQGISVVHLYSSQLKTLKLNLPKKEEQQKIASFLTSVDERIALLEKQKQGLETYKKGVMQQIFSQQLRFKDVAGKDFPDWEEKKLGEIIKVVVGGTPSTTNEEFWNGNIGWIGSGELKNNIITKPTKYITELGLMKSSTYLMPKHTVVLAMTGATLGKIGILDFECTGNQSVAGFLPSEIFDNLFLFYKLQSMTNQILSFAGGAAQAGINKKNIESLDIDFPSLKEQQKIATFLSAIDERIAVVSKQIEQSKIFKKGLLQQMFV